MSLISYNADSCIRNAYYHNSCSNCVDSCPENLFSLFQNRIKFDSSLCTYCSACLGSCPTEAIKIDLFDPNRFTLEFQFSKSDKLTCKNRTQCLSGFDSHHFTTMILNIDSLECDLSLCSECDIGEQKASIKTKISDANRVLKSLSSSKKIDILEEKVEEKISKREFFNKFVGKVNDVVVIPDIEKYKIDQLLSKDINVKRMLPTKQRILIEAIKNSKDFENVETVDLTDSFLHSKYFEEKCTNCGDCIQFCPTEALFHSSDKLSIYISANKCIGCNICHDICKIDAVQKGKSLEAIDLLRPKQLISFTMDSCTECKTPFIKRGDEVICERCIDFTTNFSSIFTLARDM